MADRELRAGVRILLAGAGSELDTDTLWALHRAISSALARIAKRDPRMDPRPGDCVEPNDGSRCRTVVECGASDPPGYAGIGRAAACRSSRWTRPSPGEACVAVHWQAPTRKGNITGGTCSVQTWRSWASGGTVVAVGEGADA